MNDTSKVSFVPDLRLDQTLAFTHFNRPKKMKVSMVVRARLPDHLRMTVSDDQGEVILLPIFQTRTLKGFTELDTFAQSICFVSGRFLKTKEVRFHTFASSPSSGSLIRSSDLLA